MNVERLVKYDRKVKQISDFSSAKKQAENVL